MAMILKDESNVTKYTFPSGIELIGEPWEQRLDSESRAYAHGGIITSDQKVSPRIVSAHGIFQEADAATMEAELKSMRKACYIKDYRLYATQNANEFYKVECLNFDFDYMGMLTTVEVNIDFLVVDGFRHYKDLTTDSHDFTTSPDNDTIANGGDAEVHPVITITGGASTATTKIKIENAQDGGRYFEYAGTISTGESVIIDCEEGTVKKNGTNDIGNFSGTFLKLASGDNSITTTVTGDVGTITLKWEFRKKWL